MDFSQFVNKVKCPDLVRKPLLGKKSTAAELREHADALDKYEADMVVYRKEMAEYHKGVREVDEAVKQVMLKDVGLQNHPKKDAIYSYCWEQGHAYGYSEVYTHLVDIATLFQDTLNHKERHEMLYKYLVELVTDFNTKLPLDAATTTTVAQLLVWSKEQTQNPT